MRIVPGAEVHRLCSWSALVEALAEAHRGPMPSVDRSEIHHTRGQTRDTFFNLPAWLDGVAMGTKVVTVLPDNPQAGVPAIQAAYVLCDGKTGTPVATIDGTALTYRKTAADSALGAKLLAREECDHLLMVGAGGLAPYLVAAHRAVRPSLKRISVWNRSIDKAEALAAECGGTAAADLEAAVRDADIICCATNATEPLVKGAWLKPGAHLDLVGSFTPEMRECDDEAVRRARLFVDSRQFAIDQPGDLAGPLSRGVIDRERIEGDLFDLCRNGLPLRRRPEDITLFKNGGGAHLDLFVALFIWEAIGAGSSPGKAGGR